MYGLRNRQKEKSNLIEIHAPGHIFHEWLFEITFIVENQTNDDFSLFRFQRYQNRLQTLLGIIGSAPGALIGIEGYSYQSTATESDTMLKELGGALRLYLCQLQHKLLEIPPSTVKKIFSGKGSAKKKDMYESFLTSFGMPDMLPLMSLPPWKQLKEPPHPVEDMTDAFAVALSTLLLTQ